MAMLSAQNSKAAHRYERPEESLVINARDMAFAVGSSLFLSLLVTSHRDELDRSETDRALSREQRVGRRIRQVPIGQYGNELRIPRLILVPND